MINGLIRDFFLFLFPKPNKNKPKIKSDPIGFPCALMLIYYIMWNISFIGDALSIGERTWGDYWNQVLVKIFYSPMLDKEPPGNIRSRTVRSHTRKRLIILGLMAASDKPTGVPNIDLSGEKILNMKLRKSRGKDGIWKISKLIGFKLPQVRAILGRVFISSSPKGRHQAHNLRHWLLQKCN